MKENEDFLPSVVATQSQYTKLSHFPRKGFLEDLLEMLQERLDPEDVLELNREVSDDDIPEYDDYDN